MPESYTIDSYVYFLVKPEYRNLVRNKIETSLRDLNNQAAAGAAKRKL